MKKVPIYGIQEFDKVEHSLYANNLRAHLEDHKFVNTHHKHSTHVCVFFTKGTGQHTIDFHSYPIEPGSIFLLNPGQVHCWSLSDDTEGHVFFHTKELFESAFLQIKIEDFPFFSFGQNNPVIYLDQETSKEFEQIFEQVTQEFRRNELYKNSKIASLINLIYIDLARLYRDSEKLQTHVHYAHIQRFQQLVDIHYKNLKLPHQYSNLMHLTTRHLSRVCAETLNTTPTHVIVNRICIEAKRMLIHSDASVSSVADELGYDDYSYFIRLFKKTVGVSPKQFQKNIHIK